MSGFLVSRFLARLTPALGLIVGAVWLAANTPGQTQKPRTPDQGSSVRIVSEEVLLDIVVRDKKGRPVTDLKSDEIEIYEDGVKQQINSFRKVEKMDTGAGAGAPNNASNAASNNTVDPL